MTLAERLKALLTLANGFALAIVFLSLLMLWLIQRQFHVNVFSEEGLHTLVDTLGWYGPFIYILLIALAVVISQLPGVPLAIAAGAIWGPLPAGLYSVVGAFLGGIIAYLLGRTLGRSAIKALTGKLFYFRKDKGDRHLGWIIFISRLIPFLSFDVISYAAGMSGLGFSTYAIATFFGMIPSTFLLTYLGSSFRISTPWALSISLIAALGLILLPFLIRRYNWFNLRDFIYFE